MNSSHPTPSQPTPRTDAQVQSTNRTIDLIGCAKDGGLGPVDAVTAEFARQLERELDETLKELEMQEGTTAALGDELAARSETRTNNAVSQAPATARPGREADQPVTNSGSAEVNTPAAAPLSAKKETEALQALADIKWDVHNCDWSCENCGTDQVMKDTDIAGTIRRFEEAHGELSQPYSASTDGKDHD